MENRICADTPADLGKVADKLLETWPDMRIFAFFGAMGAGKTTFIKQLAHKLEVKDNVSSPTFAIINEYLTASGERVYHFDFYRIKKPQEALDLGYEDYFYSGNFCLIEWPEIIEDLLPEETVRVRIETDEDSGRRTFIF
ncbi:MAG: tRNA (adenosine(37)-N6)-threonylcarbamoyltransferase complex ATPase subunit type 1 TsaE [Bacteroidota bacterium]